MKTIITGGLKLSSKGFISLSNIQLTLDSVKYKKIKSKNIAKHKDIMSVVTDSYNVLKIRDKEIEIEYSRKVDFKPKVIMNVEVVMTLVFELKEFEDVESVREEIMLEVENGIGDLMAMAASNASLIISTLTNVTLPYPLVTPPFYIIDDGVNS